MSFIHPNTSEKVIGNTLGGHRGTMVNLLRLRMYNIRSRWVSSLGIAKMKRFTHGVEAQNVRDFESGNVEVNQSLRKLAAVIVVLLPCPDVIPLIW